MKIRLIAPLSALLLMVLSAQAVENASDERLDEVAKRGIDVMSFNLEKTTHVFSKTVKGGVQQVIARDSANFEQIMLVREHLSKLSQDFMQGDFSDPAKIHGEDMPGLAELREAKSEQMSVVYKELPNGAEIDYSTDNKRLVEAIHKWFDAQLNDHGRHAMPGNANNQMHHNQ